MLLQLQAIAEQRVGEAERLVSMIHQLQQQNHVLRQQLWEKDKLLMELNGMAEYYKMLVVH